MGIPQPGGKITVDGTEYTIRDVEVSGKPDGAGRMLASVFVRSYPQPEMVEITITRELADTPRSPRVLALPCDSIYCHVQGVQVRPTNAPPRLPRR